MATSSVKIEAQPSIYVPSTFHIEQFDPTTTNWNRWLQHFEGALGVFRVDAGSRVAYLLHYIGAAAFDVLCNRIDPEDPCSQSYEQIAAYLQEFYDPAPLEIMENFRFHQRKQEEGETIQQFIAALQKLSIHCRMGAYLKIALRNQLVFGMASKRIQSRLLEVKDLTFEKAMQMALTMELSEKGGVQLQSKSTVDKAECLQTDKKTPKIQKRIKEKPSSTEAKKKTSNSSSTRNSKRFSTTFTKSKVTCFRCGNSHLATKCTLSKDITCHSCGKKGHLSKVCFAKEENVQYIESIHAVEHVGRRGKFEIELKVNEKLMRFEIDSGAAITLVSKELACSLFPTSTIHRSKLRLVTFCNTELRTYGFMRVIVEHEDKKFDLNMYLTYVDRLPIIGREWIHEFLRNGINLLKPTNSIHYITTDFNSKINELKNKYQHSIQSDKGITGLQARFTLKENASPVAIKARPVAFKLRPLIENEIHSLVKSGILVKVVTSEWATPIVPVLKKDNSVRSCGDFSVTVNPKLHIDQHPLPTVDELFASMAGGIKFSKIDLKNAYLQMEVHPDDQHLLTLSTHLGLFQSTRLLYGIASAPSIWQREIEKILCDIPGVTVFLDDIKITGSNDQEHYERLQLVLQRLSSYNLRINWNKSEFFKNKIHYCGYVIDKNGIHKEAKKLEAIDKMPRPNNVTELRAFLGLINYYRRFIRNLSTILQPLNTLLQKNTKFVWGQAQEKAFITAKEEFKSDRHLVHFDTKLPLILATDASAYGIGAILSYKYPDRSEKVIQYASQTLSDTKEILSD